MTTHENSIARYDRLATSIETGNYDLDTSSVEIRPDYQVGRPRRKHQSSTTHPLAVRLTEADRQRLAEYAARTGQPMSVVVRTAITDWLDRQHAS